MSYTVHYLLEAKLDIMEAKDWYAGKKLELRERFITQVKSALANLKSHPFHYEVRYKNLRIKHLNIFPYGIYYYIDENQRRIVIVAVLHHRQKIR